MVMGKEDIHPGIIMLRAAMYIQVTGIILFFHEAVYLFISAAILIIITAARFIVIIMVFMNPCMRRLAFV